MQSWDSQSSRGEIKDDHRRKKLNPKEGRTKKERTKRKEVKNKPKYRSNCNK